VLEMFEDKGKFRVNNIIYSLTDVIIALNATNVSWKWTTIVHGLLIALDSLITNTLWICCSMVCSGDYHKANTRSAKHWNHWLQNCILSTYFLFIGSSTRNSSYWLLFLPFVAYLKAIHNYWVLWKEIGWRFKL